MNLKRILYIAVVSLTLIAPVAIVTVTGGCKSSTQQVAYNTIYTVERTTLAAYDGYFEQVRTGKVSTNGLPQVSKAFNVFQASALVALDRVQFSTNALAPESLIIQSQDLIKLITQLTKK